MARFLCVEFVCMIRCGRPAAFMRLYKAQTIGDNVLCHATVVVSAINLLKSHGISTWWYSVREPVHCIHVLWSSHIYVAELDEPNKVANPAHSWSVEQGKLILFPRLRSRLII